MLISRLRNWSEDSEDCPDSVLLPFIQCVCVCIAKSKMFPILTVLTVLTVLEKENKGDNDGHLNLHRVSSLSSLVAIAN